MSRSLFTIRYFDSSGGRIQYVDEGQGMPIVIIYRDPAWKELCDRLILKLRQNCRCLMAEPFPVGNRAREYELQLVSYTAAFEQWLESLDLKDVRVVAFQLGVIGISYAVHYPHKVSETVIFNSGTELNGKDETWLERLAGVLPRYSPGLTRTVCNSKDSGSTGLSERESQNEFDTEIYNFLSDPDSATIRDNN